MRKRLTLILILILLINPPHVHALDTVIIDSQTLTNVSETIQDHHPSDSAFSSASGQSFNMTQTAWITQIRVYLNDALNPTCNLSISIYDHTGTYGSTGLPTGPPLATSDNHTGPFPVGVYRFNFTGANRVQFLENRTLFFVIEARGGTVDNVNYVLVITRNGNPHSGNAVNYVNGAWGLAPAGEDLYFVVIGEALWGEASDLINDAFEFFGIFNYMQQITTYINGLTTYFATSLTNILTLILQQFRIIGDVIGFFTLWMTNIIDAVLDFNEFYQSVLTDTATWTHGLGNIWTLIGYNIWSPAVAPFALIIWIDSLEKRGRQTVGGTLQVFINDVNTAAGLVGYFMSMFGLVANTIIDRVYGLFDAVI